MFKFLPEEIEEKIWRSVHEMNYASSMKEILYNKTMGPYNNIPNPDPECVYRYYQYVQDDNSGSSELRCNRTYFVVNDVRCKYNKFSNNYSLRIQTSYDTCWYTRNSILSDYENFHRRYTKEIITYLEGNGIPIPKRATRKQLVKLLLTF